MIEIGSWIGMAAITRSELTIKNVSWNDLGMIPRVFPKIRYQIRTKKRRYFYTPTRFV
jgi:UDP-N-acetylglucosamine 1-carboxyvinyltransferase